MLVTHCNGNSSGQGVVGYMRQPPEDLEVDLNRDLKQTKYRRGLGISLVCLITQFRLCIMSYRLKGFRFITVTAIVIEVRFIRWVHHRHYADDDNIRNIVVH